jgi:uncharacterized cupredoxin-like copper-binding protein
VRRGRRLAAGAVAAVALVAAVPGPVAGASAWPAAHAARTTAVGIGLREWSVTVYRRTARAGTVRFYLTNRGEDVHDLRVKGPHGYRSAISADVAPGGGQSTLVTHLRKPGVYRLVCVKPGHEQLGMRATIKVLGKS